MKTRSTPTAEAIANRKWFVVDLDGEVLGRAAARIAHVLRGKHKPTYTPHIDDGDYVIVVNAEKVKLTGNKVAQKMYWRHTGFVGGIKGLTAEKMLERDPGHLITKAVKGMLPSGPLGRAMLKKMKVHAGPDHGHEAQQPEKLDLSTLIRGSSAA